MTKEERAAWQNGYLIACCNLANMHDRPELASDVLAEGGITKSEAQAMDLTEYDQRALDKIRKARRKDPLCNGYREIVRNLAETESNCPPPEADVPTNREKGRDDFKSGAPCIPPVEKLAMYEYLDGWASAARSRA